MKIGVSTYSFQRLMQAGTMTQLEVVAKAKEMGFAALEICGLYLPAGETAQSFAPKVRDQAGRVGIELSNYTIGADFLNGSGGHWRAEVERLKEEVRIAKVLGTPGMRHDVGWGYGARHIGPRGFDDALAVLAPACRAVSEFAATQGIRTMVENHGHFCQDSVRMEKLVNGVNHSNFGVLADMGNFLCVDEDPAEALGRLGPYLFCVHAKDFHVKSGSGPDPGEGWFPTRAGNWLRGAIIGHGEVPIGQCLRLMKRAGYDGVLSVEFEGMEDPLKGIAIGAENLRRYLAAVA